MIEANSRKEYFEGYKRAFSTALTEMEGRWHPAWRYYHSVYTRRKANGEPLRPTATTSTADPITGESNFLATNEQLAVNHVQSIVRTIIASSFNRDPEFTLQPEFEGYTAPAKAKLAGAALNIEWRRRKFTDPVRDAVVDSQIYGRGWAQVGWQSTYTRPIANTNEGEKIKDAIRAVNEVSRKGARLGHKAFSPEEVADHMSRFGGKLLVEDMPTVRRVSPFDMFVDPLATEIADARWIAKRWRCPVAYAKKNSDWAAKAREALSVTGVEENSLDPEAQTTGESTEEYGGADTIWVVDFFDLGEGTWCQFSPQGEVFLRAPQDIPLTFGHPFVWIDNIDDTGNSQPISEVEVLWHHQRDMSELASALGRDRKRSQGKIVVDASRHEELRAAIEAAEDDIVVPIEGLGAGQDIRTIIQEIKFEPRSNEIMAHISTLQGWMTQASGVSDYLRGGQIGNQTATAVNAMQTASANYMGEKASKIRDFTEATAQRVLIMMLTYCRLDYYITTRAPQDPDDQDSPIVDATVKMGRDTIRGNYRVVVTSGSTEEKTPQARQARAQAIAATAMPFVQAGIVDPGKLWRLVMKEGFGIIDPTDMLTQQAFMPIPPGAEGQAAPDGGMGGVSMTPGTEAGQLGATAANERLDAGLMVPEAPPEPGGY